MNRRSESDPSRSSERKRGPSRSAWILAAATYSVRYASKGFLQFEPEDDSLPARIREIMNRKAAKLGKYQGPDSTTILLIENDDIALMNKCKMLDAILEAYPRGLPRGVDEIWFAYTPIQGKPLFRDFKMDISVATWST